MVAVCRISGMESVESSKDRKTREKTDHCNAPRCIVGNGK